jgi:hypothetical protein
MTMTPTDASFSNCLKYRGGGAPHFLTDCVTTIQVVEGEKTNPVCFLGNDGA